MLEYMRGLVPGRVRLGLGGPEHPLEGAVQGPSPSWEQALHATLQE
ncbi:hypothetical protein [Streptomyces sp. NRRL S-337]|nr:hypothetical protein [Streptomyces sp. NRRL S-337]